MPTNPEKEKQQARKFVDKVITNELENIGKINIKELIRQTIISYAVPPLSIKKFILEYYVDLGYVELEDDILIAKKPMEVVVDE